MTLYDDLQSNDRDTLVDTLYKLSRAKGRTPPTPSAMRLAPSLILSDDDEVAWRSIILFGIIYPSPVVLQSLLAAIDRWKISEPYIADAARDAVVKVKEMQLR
ncbi:hypothetical protein [Brevundimonas sp.]|uniref:hypothetical protein n=1 Tax=Brevundimonas sp. TaxID=1871086 RepID=UPI002D3EBF64|nr:hypothetical protein [Brevundimonas sp.]HYC98443.1 hypothetical protein [Brevundimonas sp.]